MASKPNREETRPVGRHFPLVGGILLISIGLAILLDQYLDTGWLSLIILPTAGLVFLFEGHRNRSFGYMIPGSLLFSLGVGAVLAFSNLVNASIYIRIGMMLVSFGAGWGAITLLSIRQNVRVAWWALIPGSILASTGLCLIVTERQIFDFVLYICAGLGLAFLAWGTFSRLFGLIIPGSLLLGIGPGIYYAWGNSGEINALARTGVMLVIFSIGWAILILFGRMVTEKFIWWPLIPGAVLAVVGWGLYIGGNPENAANFISNTGSIGLIIFGLYLMLMRRGIHH